MSIKKFSVLAVLVVFVLFSCSTPSKSRVDSGRYLKDAYKNDFLIGTALGRPYIMGQDSIGAILIKNQFNAISPENDMKCELIHPQWDKYNFEVADKFVELGKANKQFIVGHTLIWHSQLAPFVRNIKSADSLKMFMQDHITTIVSRYKGKIQGFDVVNEALNEDGTMRKSKFYDLLGDDFIVDAFRLAQKADPQMELYYNDYNIEQPAKRKGAIEIVKKIQAAGVRIDGVGIQGHWSIKGLPLEDIEQSILDFAALGVKVMFTEVDITVLPNPWDLQGADVNQNFEGNPTMNPYPEVLPDSMQVKLAKEYETLFNLFVKHKEKISRVTFWGVHDSSSWLNGWPIRGRTNYPLLFDRQYQPKPAYHRVMAVKNEHKKP